MKEVVTLISFAWNSVKPQTIQNYYRHAQIVTTPIDNGEVTELVQSIATSDAEIIYLLKTHGLDLPETFTLEDYRYRS